MMSPPRRRTERRALERELDKLEKNRDKLASLEAGGSPTRPLEVQSASLVEPIALSKRCNRCGGELRLVEHDAPFVNGERLRRVKSKCYACGKQHEHWVRVVMASVN